jgi:transposase-like protein
MAEDRQARRRTPAALPAASPASRVHDGGNGDDSPLEERRLVMQRGVSQLLFNYLPGRTVDWEDGLAIVILGGVRLSSAWDDYRCVSVLDEIAQLFERWRTRGGTIDPNFPDPTTERARFTIGLPQAIEAAVLETALVCPSCSRLSFPRRRDIARLTRGEFHCPGCRRQGLRQIPYVFVHGCGELAAITEWLPATRRREDGTIEATNHPIRCPRCGTSGVLVMPLRTERVRDMRIVCQNCDTQVVERLTARCRRCLEGAMRRRQASPPNRAPEEGSTPDQTDTIVTRIAMRVSRYSASDTYYPQTLSMLRLDRPTVTSTTDEEQTLLRRMLSPAQRPTTNQRSAEGLGALVRRLQVAEATGNREEAERIRALIAQAASASTTPTPEPVDERFIPSSPDVEKSILESLAFRQTVTVRPALAVAAQGAGSSELLAQQIELTRTRLGIRELLVVDDLPVITATFGYTRRSFEPTYEELSGTDLPTQIRAFPSLQRPAAQRLGRPEVVGTVPILAREGEHEGIFLSLDPERALRWLRSNGIELPSPELPPIARILSALEPVDRYYDDVWLRPARRLVFGLVHSLSHMMMRAVSRFAGLERTSLSEYIFLPLLGTVVFDNSSTFRLGGVETLARDQLAAFLGALSSEATECLYDASCIDHRGACHGCIHSPEICCRVFNHGLSRAFLIGGHAPWADVSSDLRIVGYWAMDEGNE